MQLSLAFLGTFQVVLAGKSITHFRSSNVQGLLVYLALQPGRALPRDVLAALFWPDEPENKARANLRQSLYQLRKLLEPGDLPFLTVTRQSVQFNRDSDFTCDVDGFLEAIELGELAAAVDRYQGDLLPGFACDSLEFETWLRVERERLHGLALTAMERLAARHLASGRVEDARDVARQHLALEPWSETAHRQLIEGLALAGNRSAALAQVERCRAVLAEELGVAPSAETLALAEAVAGNKLQPVDPNLIAGRYTLGEEIGRGAMGIVYRGRDQRSGGSVAIKMLDPEQVAQHPEFLPRFIREGEALQQLNHPNIVRMLAAAESEGRHYLVMEYIAGGDLKAKLSPESRLTVQQSLNIALDLADALTRAHRLEILHRDLKPANVLLDEDGRPRLSDFGIARFGQESELTNQAKVLGTLPYISPEACMGETLDERSDIWSFGVLLHEMLAGERPWLGPTPAETINQILNTPLPDLMAIRGDMPEALIDLLYRMLAKNRSERIPSVRLVGAALEEILGQMGTEPIPGAVDLRLEPPPEGRPVFATPTPERLRRAQHNLPVQATPFVGREAELGEMQRLLADPQVRLVTILGPGGIGKTRLALEAAAGQVTSTSAVEMAFPDGIFLVELAMLPTVEQMITAAAATFNFAIEKGIEPAEQILNFLSNKRLLLLLDNFEHLLVAPEHGAELVRDILRRAPQVKIITTSQQKLNLSSEVVLVLEGMAFSDWQSTAEALGYSAVQLFVQSARRSRVDFELTAEGLPPVGRICRLTEGMPLGIVLAGAWVDLLSLSEIADEIEADVDFLASEMGDLPPRQRSIRAVFDYSWALITGPEQQVLARLSVFQGGFAREAAQAVSGASLRQLLSLANKSLIQRDVNDGRFSLHELLGQLAYEKLGEMGETERVHTAHSHYYLTWLAEQRDGLHKYRLLETGGKIRRDELNIRAAWLWAAAQGEAGRLIPVMQSFPDYIMLTGRDVYAMRLYRETLALLPPWDGSLADSSNDTVFVRACLLNRLQDMGFDQDEQDQPIDLDRLHGFFQARGARLEEALVCQHLGYRAMRAQDFPQAMAHFQQQTEIYEQVNEVFRRPLCLGRLAMLSLYAGQIEAALAWGEQAVTVARQYQNRLHTTIGLHLAAIRNLFERQDYATAQQQYAELADMTLKSWAEGFNAINAMGALTYQGFAALLQGDMAEAQQFNQKLAEIAAVHNNPHDHARVKAMAGLINATLGRYEADSIPDMETREGSVLLIGPIGVALTAYGIRDFRLAARTIIQAWSLPITRRWPAVLLQYLPIVAALLADRGEYSRAAALMAMGWAHRASPHGWWRIMALVQELESRLQAELSSEAYGAAQALGRELDVAETAVSLLEALEMMAH